MNQITKNVIPSTVPCKKYSNEYPNFSPIIYSLSTYSSMQGRYTQVTITGNNFSLGNTIGYSVVNFGKYKRLPVTYYSSNSISFIVPIDALNGKYAVQVVNLLFPTSLYSNIVNFHILSTQLSKLY